MQVLADSGARVVAFDIALPTPSSHDDAFVQGVEALHARNVDVVIVTKSMMPDARGQPLISPVIAPKVKWGGDAAALLADTPWHLLLFAKVPNSAEPIPSFSLATLGAFRQPGADLVVNVDLRSDLIELRYARRAAADELRTSGMSVKQIDESQFGLPRGTIQGEFLLDMPPTKTLRAADVDYAEVLGADRKKLREWFEGHAVVIGDTREIGGDGPFAHHDLGWLRGCYAQAVGIDRLITRSGLITASTAITPEQTGLVLLAALLGAGAALLAARGSGRLLVYVPCVAVVIAGLSLFAYLRFRYLANPLVPIIAMVVAVLLASRAIAVRRRVLG
jgi:hypothetical protein